MGVQVIQTSQDGKLLRVGVEGGSGGDPFSGEWQLDKHTDLIRAKHVERVDVWSDGFTVHAIQVTYPGGEKYFHGDARDTQRSLVFSADEYVEQVFVRNRSGNGADGRLRHIKLKTSKGTVFSSDGNDDMNGNEQEMFTVHGYLAGFEGHCGKDIDKLEVIIDVAATEYSVSNVDYDILHDTEQKKLDPQQVAELTLTRDARADLSVPAQLTQTITTTTTDSDTWAFKVGGKIGIKTEWTGKLLYLVEGKFDISTDVTFDYSWGKTHQDIKTNTSTATVTLPAGVMSANAYVLQYATQVKVTFTMDVLVTYMDGDQASLEGVAGIFTGLKGTDLKLELKPDQPAQ